MLPSPALLIPHRATNKPPKAANERDRPLITVGIPSYNRPDLLREALASIAALRNFANYEVVVCDDGRLAQTRAVVAGCGIEQLRFYVNESAVGPIANWNRCIDLARGDWVTILHEDDILYPWFFQAIAPRLAPNTAAISVRCVQGATPPRLAEPSHDYRVVPYAPLWFLKSSMTPFPGVVFSRALARRLRGFNATEGGIADYAFWYDLACAGRVETIRTVAAFYRVSSGQWTDREWPRMLRRAHLLRLRIAREQLGHHSRAGRWLARFYSARMARSYAQRFADRPAVLRRVQRFDAIPFGAIPSGWVWAWLQALSSRRPGTQLREAHATAYALPNT